MSVPRLVVLLGAFVAPSGCSLAFGIDASDCTRVVVVDTASPREAGAPLDATSTRTSHRRAPILKRTSSARTSSRADRAPQVDRLRRRRAGNRRDDAVSPPSSLWFSTTNKEYASVEGDVGVDAAGDIRLHLDVRVDLQTTSAALAVFAIGTYLVQIGRSAEGNFDADELDVDGGMVASFTPSTLAANGAWTAVDLAVHFVPNRQAGSHATLRLDGRTVVDTDLHPTVDQGNTHLQIGVCDGPDGDLQIRLDNVYLDKADGAALSACAAC